MKFNFSILFLSLLFTIGAQATAPKEVCPVEFSPSIVLDPLQLGSGDQVLASISFVFISNSSQARGEAPVYVPLSFEKVIGLRQVLFSTEFQKTIQSILYERSLKEVIIDYLKITPEGPRHLLREKRQPKCFQFAS